MGLKRYFEMRAVATFYQLIVVVLVLGGYFIYSSFNQKAEQLMPVQTDQLVSKSNLDSLLILVFEDNADAVVYDTLPLSKINCKNWGCKPMSDVTFTSDIKRIITSYSAPYSPVVSIPIIEDYYFDSATSAKLVFERHRKFYQQFDLAKVLEKRDYIFQSHIAVLDEKECKLRLIKLSGVFAKLKETVAFLRDQKSVSAFAAITFKSEKFYAENIK